MKKQLVKIISLFSVFVLLCCPVLHLFATALSESKDVIAGKVDEKVLSAFDDGAKTAKVYVWLNDIDQKQVDKAVEQKTGLRADNLAVIDENISNELATRIVSEADNDKLTTETEKMLQAYLDRTAAQRTQERERTDLYTSTRRAEAKAKYNEKSAAFLTKNAISNEKVVFNSNYAPMLILDLTKQEINTLAAREDVESVSLYTENEISVHGLLDSTFERIDITRIKTVSGLSGAGVKIGILDPFAFDASADDDGYYFDGRLTTLTESLSDLYGHSFYVSRLAAGNDGVAHDAQIYTAGLAAEDQTESNSDITYPTSDYYGKIEQLLSAGVNVINMSCGYDFSSTPRYSARAKWIDHIVSIHNVSMVNSAGNDYEGVNYYITEEAIAENVITVGAYHNTASDGTIERVMSDYSCYSTGTGISKPDVVSVGNWYFTNTGGTSFSAPIVTGIIALLLELRPSLSSYPHVIKSIIMASCHAKASPANETDTPETMTAGLTEKQGAGIVNPYIAITIASHGTYGFGVFKRDNENENIKFLQPITDSDAINVTVTWLRENYMTTDDNHEDEYANVNSHQNINIAVKSNGSLFAEANNQNTSAEMIYAYFDENDNEDFEIVLTNAESYRSDVRYAYAWSVDFMRFQYNHPFEGIGYLKNLNSSYYLEADTTALTVSQKAFDGEANQMWILRRNINASTYQLQSAYASIGAFADSSVIGSTGASAVTVLLNEDGTYSFTRTAGTMQYILGVENDSTTSGTSIAWQIKGDSVTDSQKWYFEVCAYEKGDHDLSGHITSEDARYIMRAAVNLETPTTLQSFLCDIDGNGEIASADTRLAMRYSTGLDP